MSSTVFFWQGSPPHGRGKDAEFVVTVAGGGITPAWAGKSRTSTGSCHFWEDHPRMGGEKPVAMHSLTTKAGSPPRGRGKGWPPPPLGLSPRITPAWAGKSTALIPGLACARDHPRVGGEKAACWSAGRADTGSPPRGRGKGYAAGFAMYLDGITPAWAGKRAGQCWGLCSARDHPRVGGEKTLPRAPGGRAQGSPPRGRGKDYRRTMPTGKPRITPAWAGKRPCQERPVEGRRDHPRVGGEKITGGRCLPVSRGSPPRGRGKAAPHGFLAEVDGDHPRVGGEKSLDMENRV